MQSSHEHLRRFGLLFAAAATFLKETMVAKGKTVKQIRGLVCPFSYNKIEKEISSTNWMARLQLTNCFLTGSLKYNYKFQPEGTLKNLFSLLMSRERCGLFKHISQS